MCTTGACGENYKQKTNYGVSVLFHFLFLFFGKTCGGKQACRNVQKDNIEYEDSNDGG